MESPLRYNDDQDDEIKSQFDQLRMAIYLTKILIYPKEEIRALNDRIQREVDANRALARVVNSGNSSLLDACISCDQEMKQCHPSIKVLIEANPSALLWQSNRTDINIHRIAGHSTHCVLMPWIAANYQWVLDEIYHESPPVFALLTQYANRGEETGCTAAIIQQFFETYPRGLTQVNEDGRTPLHAILMGLYECSLDLFMWMAEQCPSNVIQTDRYGCTPLHYACSSLTHHVGDDSSEICKYLIAECPESVEVLDNKRRLPIHELLEEFEECQHQIVKEVVVCLLREYPESYDMAAVQYIPPIPAPSSVPFIQRIKPLLDEERELEENLAYLQEVSGVFRDAVEGTQTPSSLASSTCDVFVNWATATTIKRLEAKMEHISMQLQYECNVDEEEDDDSYAD